MRGSFLVLMALSALHAVELADLARERQERLYYDRDTLPQVVQELIAAPVSVADFRAFYENTRDEKIRFNILLIVDKKIREEKLMDGDGEAAVALLRDVMRDGNPWIQTEGVYALGNAGGADNVKAIASVLESRSDLALFHALIAYNQVTGQVPELDEAKLQRIKKVSGLSSEERQQLAEREWTTFMSSLAY